MPDDAEHLRTAATDRAQYLDTYLAIDGWVRRNRALGPISGFMNYGYRDRRANPLVRPEVRLFRRAFAPLLNAQPSGSPILEVGCGRCGNLAQLSHSFPQTRILGLDLVRQNLVSSACAATRGRCSCALMHGDARHLPLRSASAFAVVSLESVHSYEDPARFLFEAIRVVEPGGIVAMADFAPPSSWDDFVAQVAAAADCHLLDLTDLTAGVLAARGKAGTLMRRLSHGELTEEFAEFLALPGTKVHRGLASGSLKYMSMSARVEAEGRPTVSREEALSYVSRVGEVAGERRRGG